MNPSKTDNFLRNRSETITVTQDWGSEDYNILNRAKKWASQHGLKFSLNKKGPSGWPEFTLTGDYMLIYTWYINFYDPDGTEESFIEDFLVE